MNSEWWEALLTASAWGPPSVLAIVAIVREEIRFRGQVAPAWAARWIVVIWLAPLPLVLLISVARILMEDPSPEAVARLGREFAPSLLRMLSILALIAGWALALSVAGPEPEPKPGPRRKPKKPRRSRRGKAGKDRPG